MQSKTTLSIRPKTKDSDSRRRFLRYAGFTAVAAPTILTACENENALLKPSQRGTGARVAADGSIDLGSGDVGILNYAYALKQLEYAFYKYVTDTVNEYDFMLDAERVILKDIRDHEKIHRDFLRASLSDREAIQELTIEFFGPNFRARNPELTPTNFTQRDSVLTLALMFEDLGVSAYNGAGELLSDGNYLGTVAKIVSVEARHAAIVRELFAASSDSSAPFTTSFAGDDVVTWDTGLDRFNTPSTVLAAAQPYIVERITCGNLPTMQP